MILQPRLRMRSSALDRLALQPDHDAGDDNGDQQSVIGAPIARGPGDGRSESPGVARLGDGSATTLTVIVPAAILADGPLSASSAALIVALFFAKILDHRIGAAGGSVAWLRQRRAERGHRPHRRLPVGGAGCCRPKRHFSTPRIVDRTRHPPCWGSSRAALEAILRRELSDRDWRRRPAHGGRPRWRASPARDNLAVRQPVVAAADPFRDRVTSSASAKRFRLHLPVERGSSIRDRRGAAALDRRSVDASAAPLFGVQSRTAGELDQSAPFKFHHRRRTWCC